MLSNDNVQTRFRAVDILLMLLLVGLLSACLPEPISHVTPVASIQVTGTIMAKERAETPTSEDTCQMEYEYYVLVSDTQRYVLNCPRDPVYSKDDRIAYDKAQEQLKQLVGHHVTVDGQTFMLGLSEGDIVCTWLRVSSVKEE